MPGKRKAESDRKEELAVELETVANEVVDQFDAVARWDALESPLGGIPDLVEAMESLRAVLARIAGE